MKPDLASTKVSVTEYALRMIKDSISAWRRDNLWLLGINVFLPVEAETSIFYLQQHYPSAQVKFNLSTDIRYGDLVIEKKEVDVIRAAEKPEA